VDYCCYSNPSIPFLCDVGSVPAVVVSAPRWAFWLMTVSLTFISPHTHVPGRMARTLSFGFMVSRVFSVLSINEYLLFCSNRQSNIHGVCKSCFEINSQRSLREELSPSNAGLDITFRKSDSSSEIRLRYLPSLWINWLKIPKSDCSCNE